MTETHDGSHSQAALVWITDLLHKLDIPYQIQGGLAAKAYGAKRNLVDIDIDIPQSGFNKIAGSVKDYVTYGPAHYKDNSWDIFLMTLSYKGQEIDLTDGENIKMFYPITGHWIKLVTDFSSSCLLDVMGVRVPVIPRDALISYKKIAARQVDLFDIHDMENHQY